MLQNTGPAGDELDVVENTLASVAHVLGAGVHAGLPVPDVGSALDQSRVHQAAAALRVQHVLADLLQIPAVVGFLDEPGKQLDRVLGLGQSRWHAAGAGTAGRGGRREGVRVILVGALRDGRRARSLVRRGQVGRQGQSIERRLDGDPAGGRRDGKTGNQVDLLLGIGDQIEQHGRVDGRVHELPAATADHDQRCLGALAHVLAVHGIGAETLAAGQVGHEGDAVERQLLDQRSTNHLRESGQQVHGRHILRDTLGGKTFGGVNEHGHTSRVLEPGHLVPQATLTEHVAVITAEDNDSIFIQTGVLQHLEQLADVGVDVRASGVVCTASILDVLLGHLLAPEVDTLQHTLGVGILLLMGDGPVLGHRDVNILVHVPVLLGHGVGVVRVGHGHRQTKRLIGARADVVVQVLLGLVDDLLVKVELVGADDGAGVHHRRHVVVKVEANLGLVPVDGPAVVTGVDVTGETLLVAVQLVRPAEVHLTGEGRVVTLATQVVGIGGDVGGQIRRVVVSPNLRGQLAADHHEARRGTQRSIAIGRVEDDTLPGQPVEVGGFDGGVLVVQRQQGRRHLVGHDVQDVRLLLRHDE